MWYENTPDRGADRGFNPDRGVVFGPETRDEMMLGFINWAPAEPYEAPVETPSASSGSD